MKEKNIVVYTRRKALFSATIAATMMPFIASAQTNSASDDQASYVLGVDGMACPFCSFGVEKKLSAIDGVSNLKTNILAGTVFVSMEPGKTLSEEDARRAVEEAGFDLREFKITAFEKDPEAT